MIIEQAQDIPITSIPYKNRWGHWVWQRKDDRGARCMSWPGIKPPNKEAYPVPENGKWVWKEVEDDPS